MSHYVSALLICRLHWSGPVLTRTMYTGFCRSSLTNHYLDDQIKKRWTGHVARMGGTYRVLMGRPEEKRPLWRHRRILKDNIKIHFQEVGCGIGLDWSGSGKGQVTISCECCHEPWGSIKCRKFIDCSVSWS